MHRRGDIDSGLGLASHRGQPAQRPERASVAGLRWCKKPAAADLITEAMEANMHTRRGKPANIEGNALPSPEPETVAGLKA